jgi:hypothetical protein
MNAKEFSAFVESVDARKTAAEAERARQTRIANDMAVLSNVLNRLCRSWRDTDPGKYGPHWFFVKNYKIGTSVDGYGRKFLERVEKIWIQELIDDFDEAKKGRRQSSGNALTPVPLGTMCDVAMLTCSCAGRIPLVGCYEQTEDGPDGDTWVKAIHALCPTCATLTLIACRVEDHRF